MAKPTNNPKLKLLGFNNLTKSLSFNIYDICYARNQQQQQEYIEYIDEAYNAERLTAILTEVAHIIGANILNVARQDYDPQGASVTMLISEGHLDGLPDPSPTKKSVVSHLDKSHITVHTYPETHPHNGIATFRADIDVATCGVISPLKALNYLIESFDSDIVVTDYRMKHLDGLEFIRMIRESGSVSRVIMLSGFATALGMTPESTGADEVIAKSNKEVPELLRAR